MYFLTACLIFQNAASYLDEWLRFHTLVGVEHFYLYDNDSDDDFRFVIRPFQAEGRVTLHKWPGTAQQENAFRHCLNQYRGSAQWIAFLDDDEFLFPAIGENVPEILRDYDSYAGVAVCWLLFGSNGHLTRPPGLVTHNYRRRADWVDPHVKCVVNPNKVTEPAVLGHSFRCRPGEQIVDENHRPVSGPFVEVPSANVLCVNHYLIKSHEELIQRRARRRADGGTSHSIEEWKRFDSSYDQREDLRIQRFAVSL